MLNIIYHKFYDFLNGNPDQIMFSILFWLLVSEIPIYLFSIIDYLKLNYFHKYLIQYEQYKIRNYPSIQNFKKAFYESEKNFIFVYFLPSIIFIYISNSLKFYPYRLERNITNIIILKEILIISLIADFLFYWLHRMVHLPKLYKKIHKKHHEYKHSFAFVHHYMSRIDAIIFIFPQIIPALLIHSHIWSMILAFVWTQWNAILGHSGYRSYIWEKYFNWIPYMHSTYHDIHHLEFNYNYGAVYTFTDKIFGTFKNLIIKK